MITNKTVLITGAARGIGAEAARQFSALGANVVLVGLEPELMAQLSDSLPNDSAWFEADVCNWQQLEQAFTDAAQRFGSIDIVLANAGIAPIGSVEKIDIEQFEKTIDVNLLGVWRTARLALPHLLKSDGYLIAIASIAATVHLPNGSQYSASKAGVEAFCDSLRIELRKTGVDVGVAYFSFIDTDLVATSMKAANLKTSGINPLARTYPLEVAVAALVKGMLKRKRRVVFPNAVRPLVTHPKFAQWLIERRYKKSKKRR